MNDIFGIEVAMALFDNFLCLHLPDAVHAVCVIAPNKKSPRKCSPATAKEEVVVSGGKLIHSALATRKGELTNDGCAVR